MAIKHGSGPALVYAGPGTGKTYTITHHILFLIDHLKISPDRILVITFTKEAAKEMKARFLRERPKEGRDVNFGTFHSIYYKILTAFGNCKLKIASEFTKNKIIASIIPESDRSVFLDLVSSHKSGKSPEILIPDELERNTFLENERLYNEILKENRLMDFDDILIKCHELLSSNESVRKQVSERFSHILADEFQDINGIQYEILKLILPADRSIYAVGDENQSIYGFRGSKFGIFNEFLNDFPEAAKYRLSINYRNHRSIFTAAATVIDDKEYTETINVKEDGGFFLNVSDSKDSEHELFLKDLEERLKNGESCLIMSRTNRDLAALEQLCLPVCEQYGTHRRAADCNEKELLKIIECMKELLEYGETGSRQSLFKALSIKEDYLPRSLFMYETVDLDNVMIPEGNEALKDRIEKLKSMSRFIRHTSAPGFVGFFRSVYLRGVSVSDQVIEELNDIETEAIKLKTLKNLKVSLYERCEILRKKTEEKRDKASENPAFLTFHASKGLEYDAVFIPDVIDGKIPKRNQLGKQDEDEERRLFYVAMTRARNRLYVYTVRSDGGKSVVPSRFIEGLL